MTMRGVAVCVALLVINAGPAFAAPDDDKPESSIVVVKKKNPTTDNKKKKTVQPPPATPSSAAPSPTAAPPPRTAAPARQTPPPPTTAPPVEQAPLPGGKIAEPKKKASIAPLIGIGVSTALGIAGGVFAARALSAINSDTVIEIDPGNGGTVELPEEFEERERRVLTNGLAATILLSAATSGLLASIISLTD